MPFNKYSSARRPTTAAPTSGKTLSRPLVVVGCRLVASSAAAKAASRAISPRSIVVRRRRIGNYLAAIYLFLPIYESKALLLCPKLETTIVIAESTRAHGTLPLLNTKRSMCSL